MYEVQISKCLLSEPDKILNIYFFEASSNEPSANDT